MEKSKPPRIRITTQLVILGCGNNDANRFYLCHLAMLEVSMMNCKRAHETSWSCSACLSFKYHDLTSPWSFLPHHLYLSTTMSSAEPASVSPMPEGIADPNYKPLPGRLGNLTPGQQHALSTLKKQLQDEGHFVPERMDDATLLRCVLCLRGPDSRSPRVLYALYQRPRLMLMDDGS
jgi:hypothetical protein